jgi:chromosome segregation protein
MHITRLRLLGFKSFVEPTELLIERGLTGVVGPNGCGKSNLLEALRWVMGETSHKSMRAAAMDDVIFAGTSSRPARSWAEVTLFLDNRERKAPAGFNDGDVLEITRRIEREAGSAYRINGDDARARDVKVLFEDAATGARSPALVRQGQIAEIVNAKPEQRRRILEDAAGIAGLHTRRHEAELRLRAAESNLVRIGDVIGQLASQIESLKRQARQAKRFRDLSGDIRRAEALLMHLGWQRAQAEVEAREGELTEVLGRLAQAVAAEARATADELRQGEALPALREGEATRAAVLARLGVERDNFEREVERRAARDRELVDRLAQLAADREREEAGLAATEEMATRLASEQAGLAAADAGAEAAATASASEEAVAQHALAEIEARLKALTSEAFEVRARRTSAEAAGRERRSLVERLRRQLVAIDAQGREVAAKAPDVIRLAETQAEGQALADQIADVEAETETAETERQAAAGALATDRQVLEAARLAAERAATERETLAKLLLTPAGRAFPPVLDAIEVEPGYEAALGAALGDDLEAALEPAAPQHWRAMRGARSDGTLPQGIELLADRVKAPAALARRLAQVGVVARSEGGRLQSGLRPGQRLVSREGDLWRWDGYVSAAEAPTAAARRLAERNRLASLARRSAELDEVRAAAEARFAESSSAHAAAETRERGLRQLWRDSQARMARTREALTVIERAARETEARLAGLAEAKAETVEALAEALEKVAEMELVVEGLAALADPEPAIVACEAAVAEARRTLAAASTRRVDLTREASFRRDRLAALAAELARSTDRAAAARRQLATLARRADEIEQELARCRVDPAEIERQRQRLLNTVAGAERDRKAATDALAAAETALAAASQSLKTAHATVVAEREVRARLETRLETARGERTEAARRIREAFQVAPDGCLALAGIEAGQEPPSHGDVERQLARLKSDRDRLGGVNLEAESELQALSSQHDGLAKERADVEEAIGKLRTGIGQLNREGRRRLMEAFGTVDGHFQRLFATLFGGGEARLEMIESEDPLEGGLEIIAKPPGKKPATLSLLSGGEQTLTALSLIFAVFLTNPSPICVLDEVDAPLDDANVDRFCTLMERMAADTETRFLVITHHPMTMARMNRLFGVTMGEKGVSQLVSVDLSTAERIIEVDAQQAAAG